MATGRGAGVEDGVAGLLNQRDWDTPIGPLAEDRPHWVWRLTEWVVATWRPYLGWPVFLVSLVLLLLPALGLGENRVAELRRIQAGVDLAGPLAVLTTWLWLGWRQPFNLREGQWWRVLGVGSGMAITAVLVLAQILVGWLPTLPELWNALRSNGWADLGGQIGRDWALIWTRFALWWQGVQTGGVAQDNLIFAALAGLLIWLCGVLLAILARRYQQGLLAAAPTLWLLGTLILYSTSGRSLMVVALLLTIALHFLLDQHTLVERWQRKGLDYSPGLLVDRSMTVLAVVAVIMMLAALLPNWYAESIVLRYYDFIEPFDRRLEAWRDRLFPDLKGASRLRAGGGLDGLPNEFLLSGDLSLGEQVVMRVRTNDYVEFNGPSFEQLAPPGHYMRGLTLAYYDGHGWSNPEKHERQEHNANERWDLRELKGRKPLVQSVTLLINSSILYGAAEQLEPGVDYEADLRGAGDLVALWSRARNYTLVSAIPAVSGEQLAATPAWGAAQPLPPGYEVHLQLPSTITDRTRQLATQLTAGLDSPFAKAQAIERYLRQYEYDLNVSKPPATVEDVADYFLFDLRKGYCDYYATAFIVLARLAGLPVRFATGYAVGHWNEIENLWLITEAEAHSWPEVYFPDYGWIPFEPTAGRPELARIGLPEFSVANNASLPVPAPPDLPTPAWSWQMLVWLLPAILLGWGGVTLITQWQRRREDPWLALLRWGQRAGRPMQPGETVLEYGSNLAGYIVERQTREADVGRVAARAVAQLSSEVNKARYAPAAERNSALAQAAEHWQRVRGYLDRMRLR